MKDTDDNITLRSCDFENFDKSYGHEFLIKWSIINTS